MPSLRYIGADESEDSNALDIVNKGDVDSEFSGATVSQIAVQSAITTAVSSMASSTYVNNALASYVESNFLANNSYTMTIEGSSITGTYTLTYASQATVALPPTATTVQVQIALESLTTVINTATVTGSTGGPYIIHITPIMTSTLTANDTSLTNGQVVINPSTLIPQDWVGEYVAPLTDGAIPSEYVPSLGVGYVLGPFGATTTYPATTGGTPAKIADWALGPIGIVNQPQVFMSLLVSGSNGARPVVDVCISSGQQSYPNQTLIARGVGRSCWNDLQAITVLSVPSTLGHTGSVNTGYSSVYNTWISAWVYDANGQSVSVLTNNIVNAGVWFWRQQQ